MKIYLTIVLLLITSFTFAQSVRPAVEQKKVDSLNAVINTTLSDTVKCLSYYELSKYYKNKHDSCLLLINVGLRISEVENYRYGTARGKMLLGEYFMFHGNYPASLKNSLDAAAIFRELKKNKDLINCYALMASLYDDLKQDQTAINYEKEIVKIALKNNYQDNLLTAYGTMAYYYCGLKMYKEALKYNYLVQAGIKKYGFGGDDILSFIYFNLGSIYMGMKRHDLGLMYLKKGAYLAEKENNNQYRTFSYEQLSIYYDKVGLTDSARFFAEKTLKSALAFQYDAMTLTATEKLARLNVNHDNNKAIALYKEALAINKRIFDTEKTRHVENLTTEERQRQQDLLTEQKKAAEERKRNLQLAGIALFIPFFLVLALAISRTKVSSRVIEFMSVLGLLLVFEFITLLIHPAIEELTHHTPVLVYLILVILAAGLVPLHHYLTHWLKAKLSDVHHRHLNAKLAPVAVVAETTEDDAI